MRGLEAGRHTVSVSVAHLAARAPGYLSRQVDLPETGDIQLDFVAPKDGATVQLTVVDQDVDSDRVQMPPFLAQGEVSTPPTVAEWQRLTPSFAQGTRENGATVFRGLPPGHYTLFVFRTARAKLGVYRETLDVEPGGYKSIRVNLPTQLPTLSLDEQDER